MSNRKTDKADGKALTVVDMAKDELTPQEADFVRAYVTGGEAAGNQTKAAEAAGSVGQAARAWGARAMQRPRVIAAIDAALREEIGTRLTVRAVQVIADIIDNKEAPLKLRGEMAARVVEFSGLVERTKAIKAKETGLGGKTLGELSRAELMDVVAKGAAVLKAAGAADKTIEGVSARNSAQVEDISGE